MSKSKLLIAAAIALGTTLATGAAQAGHQDDVQWSVTIGSPVGVPRYVPPTVVHTQPVVVYPQPVYGRDHRYDRHHRQYRQPTRWDSDGDGIPNRYDRRYNPAWDIDGDGIANRHDRDRDGDGVPNRYDRRDGYGDNVATRHRGYR